MKGFIHIPILLVAGVALVVLVAASVASSELKQEFVEKYINLKKTTIEDQEISDKDETQEQESVSSQEEKTSPSPIPTPTPSPTPIATQTPEPTPTPPPVSNAPPTSGFQVYTLATERGTFTFRLVSIDMGGVRMITDTANDDDCADNCATLSLGDFVSRNGGFAGINGSYFCPRTYDSCGGKGDSFDFPVYNSRLGKWINGGNLFWNNRSVLYTDGGGAHFLRNANSFGGGLSAGVVNHPGLLKGGNVIADQFGLEPKQSAKGTKSGIGIRGNIIYLVVASGVDVFDLAHIFKSLGATTALNLDGGGSSALWFGGYKAGPGRNIPNAIIFAR